MNKTEWFILVAIIAIMLLCSCGAKRTAVNNNTSDTARIIVRTQTIYVPDTVYITLPLQASERVTPDSASLLETDYSVSSARINPDGTLFHSLKTKAQTLPFAVNKPVEKTDSVIVRSSASVQTEYVKRPLTRFQRFEIAGFWVLAFAALMLGGMYVFKKKVFVS